MKVKINVQEMSHGELVSLFSTATYGNDMCGMDVAEDSYELRKQLLEDDSINTNCLEDIWAEVLLHGGNLLFIDYEGDAENDDDAKANAYNGVTKDVGYFHRDSWSGGYGCTYYKFNLQDLFKGFKTAKDLGDLDDVNEGIGDMWDAYNLMQRIFFGEEIYG